MDEFMGSRGDGGSSIANDGCFLEGFSPIAEANELSFKEPDDFWFNEGL